MICFICEKKGYGHAVFSNDNDGTTNTFCLCATCYNNFIKAFQVSRETVQKAKMGQIDSLFNKARKQNLY